MTKARTLIIDEEDIQSVNAIAAREGVLPACILRGLISGGIRAYEAEHGPLSIDNVSKYSWTTNTQTSLPSAQTDESVPSSSASTAA